MKIKKLILAASILAVCSPVLASEVSLGLTSTYSPAVYKGLDSNVEYFPMFGYEGEHFYLRGVEAGYRIMPQYSPLNVIFRMAYDPRTLKPGDSSDLDIRKLDERKAGVLGGVTLQASGLAGTVQLSGGTAINNDETGFYGEIVWKKHFNRGVFGFIPEMGYAYNSAELNDHLYGVSTEEASRTRFEEFKAGSSGKAFVGLSAYAMAGRNIRVTLSTRYTKLDSAIADSPLIKRDDALSGSFGVSYIF
jgi:outer membrane protein